MLVDADISIRVITHGRTGVDHAAWHAARTGGLRTGGWMPEGFLTEEGPRPGFSQPCGARELPGGGYEKRTRANAWASGGTIWFGDAECRGD